MLLEGIPTNDLLEQAGNLTDSAAINYIVAGELVIIIALVTGAFFGVRAIWRKYWTEKKMNDEEKRVFSNKLIGKFDKLNSRIEEDEKAVRKILTNHGERITVIETKIEKDGS